MSMKRNLDSEDSLKYWGFVQQVADRVSHWPAWKQVQYRTVIEESCVGSRNEHSGTPIDDNENDVRTRRVA